MVWNDDKPLAISLAVWDAKKTFNINWKKMPQHINNRNITLLTKTPHQMPAPMFDTKPSGEYWDEFPSASTTIIITTANTTETIPMHNWIIWIENHEI